MGGERKPEQAKPEDPPVATREEEIEEIEDLDAPAKAQDGVVGGSLIHCETH